MFSLQEARAPKKRLPGEPEEVGKLQGPALREGCLVPHKQPPDKIDTLVAFMAKRDEVDETLHKIKLRKVSGPGESPSYKIVEPDCHGVNEMDYDEPGLDQGLLQQIGETRRRKEEQRILRGEEVEMEVPAVGTEAGESEDPKEVNCTSQEVHVGQEVGIAGNESSIDAEVVSSGVDELRAGGRLTGKEVHETELVSDEGPGQPRVASDLARKDERSGAEPLLYIPESVENVKPLVLEADEPRTHWKMESGSAYKGKSQESEEAEKGGHGSIEDGKLGPWTNWDKNEIGKRERGTMAAAPYDILRDIQMLKPNINFGQLLYHSPSLRNDLKQGMAFASREKRMIQVAYSACEPGTEYTIPIRVGNRDFAAILDGGANCNIASAGVVPRDASLSPANILIRVANGHLTIPRGIWRDVGISVRGKTTKQDFVIIDEPGYEMLLGRPFLKAVKAKTDWAVDSFSVEMEDEEFIWNLQDSLPSACAPAYNAVTVGTSDQLVAEEVAAELRSKFSAVFASSADQVGFSKIFLHNIDTGTANPMRARLKRFSPKENEAIRQHVDQMLLLGKIRPSKSPWLSNIVMVPKKDGSIRVCVDYRGVNNVTKKNASRIPNIEEIIEAMGHSTVFSSLDLFSGYWQVGMREDDIEKTAFGTKFGNYEYLVMPFGLTNAPATFQTMMEKILEPLLFRSAIVFIDDITVFSPSLEQHRIDLENCLDLISKAGLKLNSKKCSLCQKEINVLGMRLSANGVAIQDSRKQQIEALVEPRNVKELRSCLGFFSYFRRFVPKFAQIVQPMNHLLRNDRKPWAWTGCEEESFKAIKEALATSAALKAPDFEDLFEVYCDASNTAISGVIMQDKRLVNCASRCLSDSEKKYTTTEREALAIFFTLKKFRHYLLGSRFLLRTDHKCLATLLQWKDPTGRLSRWLIYISQFDVKIEHIAGEKNVVADFLSRNVLLVDATSRKEGKLQLIADLLKGKVQWPDLSHALQIEIAKEIRRFYLEGATLYRRNDTFMDTEVVLERARREQIIAAAHENTHTSAEDLFHRLNRKYHWPGMYGNCAALVGACHTCQLFSKKKGWKDTGGIPMSAILHRWHIDFVGPLQKGSEGSKFVLVAVEQLSRFTVAAAVASQESVVVIKFIKEKIFEVFGPCKTLTSDRGSSFISREVSSFLKNYCVNHICTTAYNPQANGLVERTNGLLCSLLAKTAYASGKKWNEVLSACLHNLNTRIVRSISLSPFEIVFGTPCGGGPRELEMSLSKRIAQLKINESERNLAEQKGDQAVDHRVVTSTPDPRKIQAGDLVIVKDMKPKDKLGPKYFGPFLVHSMLLNGNVRLKNAKGEIISQVINGNRILKYNSTKDMSRFRLRELSENRWKQPYISQGQFRSRGQ